METTSTTSYVYAIIRTDYLDKSDSEGRANLLSIHATVESANNAVKEHIKKHNDGHGLEDPNTYTSTDKDGKIGAKVMVGDEEYHSYSINIFKEELTDGLVVPTEAEEEKHQVVAAVKEVKTKAKAKPKTKAAKPEPEPEDDEDEDDEDDEDSLKKAPTGAPNCLAGLTFLITGTLEGFTRKEATELIDRYGGSLEASLKDTVDYVILGVRAGPKKLEEMKKMDLVTIGQREFYDLIKTRKAPKGGAKRAAPAAEDKAKPKAPRKK